MQNLKLSARPDQRALVPHHLGEPPAKTLAQSDDNKGLDFKLRYAWLDAEREVLNLEERKRECEREHRALCKALGAAKNCRGQLRKQVKEALKPAANHKQGEQAERQDLDFELNWLDNNLDELSVDEERPRKKSCVEVRCESEFQLETPSISVDEPFLAEHSLDEHSLAEISPAEIPAAELELEPILEASAPQPEFTVEPPVEQVVAPVKSGKGRDVLNEWLAAHHDNPYPSDEETKLLADETGKTFEQVKRWFEGARKLNGLARSCHNFSEVHKKILIESFDKNEYPNPEELQRLAGVTGASVERLKGWFGSRRKRHGKVTPREKTPEQVAHLRAWLHDHWDSPYPSAADKVELMQKSGLELKQVSVWFNKVRAKIKGKEAFTGPCPCCGEERSSGEV